MATDDLNQRVIQRNMALASTLREIAEFAKAHHHEQPTHELLYALTVDIPEMCEKAMGRWVFPVSATPTQETP
jgi:hypothetical protein